jgi:hypothetical protein
MGCVGAHLFLYGLDGACRETAHAPHRQRRLRTLRRRRSRLRHAACQTARHSSSAHPLGRSVTVCCSQRHQAQCGIACRLCQAVRTSAHRCLRGPAPSQNVRPRLLSGAGAQAQSLCGREVRISGPNSSIPGTAAAHNSNAARSPLTSFATCCASRARASARSARSAAMSASAACARSCDGVLPSPSAPPAAGSDAGSGGGGGDGGGSSGNTRNWQRRRERRGGGSGGGRRDQCRCASSERARQGRWGSGAVMSALRRS